ncbi:14948_t:CDS:1 [Acaulospora colombiana]|uniref:14948_t:CDS:1 n=1 Tax=Acaulospora colombiana TaxID=27376 RepID=A0ACA9MRI3_9GLOM|nr:14948_t:CDS:1 [Acaulospora colombiana]
MPRSSKQTNIGDFYTGSKASDKGKKRRDKEPKTPIKLKKSKQAPIIEIEDSDEEDDLRNVRLQPSSPPLTSPTLIPDEQTSEEEEEPPIEQTPLAKSQRRKAAGRVSDLDTSDSDENVPLNLANSKRKRLLSEDSEGGQPKKKRVLKRGLRPNREEKEVLDDLDKNGTAIFDHNSFSNRYSNTRAAFALAQ